MKAENKITVRPKQMNWSQNLPRFWYGESVFVTHYFNAMSLMFPIGEKFFIDSLKRHFDHHEKSELTSSVKNFIAQESWHSKAHTDFNKFLADLNLPAVACEQRLARRAEDWKARHNSMEWLAATVCYEHMTTTMAREILLHQGNCKDMHPYFASLWRWHAMEELEHKAVAFDLYHKVHGGYWLRTVMMAKIFHRMNVDIFMNLIDLLRADGKLWSPKIWLEGFRFLFGFKFGIFWRTGYDTLTFFHPKFHPDQVDDSKLLARTRDLVVQEKFPESQSNAG